MTSPDLPRSSRPAYQGFLWRLVRRDLLERHAGTMLGPFWTLALPLAQVVIFTMVFGTLFASRLPGGGAIDYVSYLVSGVLPWSAFSTTVMRTAGVLSEQRGILTKTPVPILPVTFYITVSEAVILALTMVIFTTIRFFAGDPLSWNIIVLPFLIVQIHLCGFALGLIAAIASIIFRDVREAIGLFLQFWFWLTPIVYVIDVLPHWLQTAQLFNPAYWLLRPWHTVIAFKAWPSIELLIAGTVATAFVTIAVIWLMSRLERPIRDLL